MDKPRIEFEEMYQLLRKAQGICPPDEFNIRQRQLLHAIAEFLLAPYFSMLEKEDHEFPIKVLDKEMPVEEMKESPKPTKKELLDMLDAMAKNIENLPQQAMTLPINHYDFYSLMLLLSSILKDAV